MPRCATKSLRVTFTGTFAPGMYQGMQVRTVRVCNPHSVSTAEHHTAAEQYTKTCRTKPLKQLSKSHVSWKTHKDFVKIPKFGYSGNRSKMLLESLLRIQCHCISISSESFSTVLQIVIAGDWDALWMTVWMVSNHSLTMWLSRGTDSATITLSPVDDHGRGALASQTGTP